MDNFAFNQKGDISLTDLNNINSIDQSNATVNEASFFPDRFALLVPKENQDLEIHFHSSGTTTTTIVWSKSQLKKQSIILKNQTFQNEKLKDYWIIPYNNSYDYHLLNQVSGSTATIPF